MVDDPRVRNTPGEIDWLPPGFVLSVIVPVFNERDTISRVVCRLRCTGIPMQIILVDDGSTNGSGTEVERFSSDVDTLVVRHQHNLGKGAAIRTGIEKARGDVIVVQDADEEYDPRDLCSLLQVIIACEADVVYGVRCFHKAQGRSPWWHRAVNQLLTQLANGACGTHLSDIETCYKMARREHYEAVKSDLREARFGIEIELTARWMRLGLRFAERPIHYEHRSYEAGKKIGWKDGVSALRCIIKYGCLRR